MLLVIFGAGASYDSSAPNLIQQVPSQKERYRPPLARQLFDRRFDELFREEPYAALTPVANRLKEAARSEEGLERGLEVFRSESEEHPIVLTQLMALRYYIRHLVMECDLPWLHAVNDLTNHRTLLDRLRRGTGATDTIWLATFNYDRILEHALSVVDVRSPDAYSMDWYINDPLYRLVKLHGSVDWAREIENPEPGDDGLLPHTFTARMIKRAPALQLSDRYRRSVELWITPRTPDGLASQAVPAIAIPTESKLDFECPKAHLDALVNALPTVNRLLVIGWKGTEEHFLQLLDRHLPRRGVKVLLVCGERSGGSAEVLSALRRRLPFLGSTELFDGGFSRFVTGDNAQGIEHFARQT